MPEQTEKNNHFNYQILLLLRIMVAPTKLY